MQKKEIYLRFLFLLRNCFCIILNDIMFKTNYFLLKKGSFQSSNRISSLQNFNFSKRTFYSEKNIVLNLIKNEIIGGLNTNSIIYPDFFTSINQKKYSLVHKSAVWCVCFDRTGRYVFTVSKLFTTNNQIALTVFLPEKLILITNKKKNSDLRGFSLSQVKSELSRNSSHWLDFFDRPQPAPAGTDNYRIDMNRHIPAPYLCRSKQVRSGPMPIWGPGTA